MHAYGDAATRRVFIDIGPPGVKRLAVPPMTIREATQLQIQLGVAIGEANGQMKMDLSNE